MKTNDSLQARSRAGEWTRLCLRKSRARSYPLPIGNRPCRAQQTMADIEAIDIGNFSPARRDTFQTAETLDQRRCYSYPALRHSTTDSSFQKSQNSKADCSRPALRQLRVESFELREALNSPPANYYCLLSLAYCLNPTLRNSMPIFPNLSIALSNQNSSNSEFLFLNLNWLISAFPYWKPRRWNRNCQRSESERLRRYFVPQNQQSVH